MARGLTYYVKYMLAFCFVVSITPPPAARVTHRNHRTSRRTVLASRYVGSITRNASAHIFISYNKNGV